MTAAEKVLGVFMATGKRMSRRFVNSSELRRIKVDALEIKR